MALMNTTDRRPSLLLRWLASSGHDELTSYVIQVPVATTDGNAPNGTNTITGPVYSHVAPKTSGTDRATDHLQFSQSWMLA